MRIVRAFALLLCGLAMVMLVVSSSPARADTALPWSSVRPSSRPTVAFAVVVGNNRSLGGRRPDLHYADDDAAKYYELLDTVAPDRVALLADFDDDTARLFPAARARAVSPTRAELLRAGQEVARAVAAAAESGADTDVYFVFAGHGDVDEGMGFIDLADARFTSSDLEAWLRAIPFSRAHVILDSCNSFFMLSARGPGGHYYATSEDAARTLSARLPNVGVFLSTSAEGESFEWSEIQSGVFSHVVRSGLSGAADANGDGVVSYVELAAFVATATADVANPNMRPHVFARGPGGRDDTALVAIAGRAHARMFRLGDGASLRVRLRDRLSIPVLDAHQEAGRDLVVALPEAWAGGATVERAFAPGRAPLETYAVRDSGDVTLASLEPLAGRGSARGPAQTFDQLFTRPFGPHALAVYEAEAAARPPAVYGVSREDAERMDLLLGQIASAEHGERLVAGYGMLGMGAFLGTVGGSAIAFAGSLQHDDRSSAYAWGGAYAGIGALALGAGFATLLQPWGGERAATEYRDALGATFDYARAFAVAETRLRALAQAERCRRFWARILSGTILVASAAALTYNEFVAANDTERIEGRAFGGAGVFIGGVLLARSSLVESPIERLTNVWESDPGMQHLQQQPTITPNIGASAGGLTLGLSGSF
ncbi:MAG TPA: hypothetical protein VK841_21415 [Polyangiaceae bacterium]|nr:hypothetical protein [Polyangiaceae bacterium]